MGYNARLNDRVSGVCLEAQEKHQMAGSVKWEGGTRDLELDFTFNYSRIFERVLGTGGIKNIYGMTGADVAPVLEYAARRLKDNTNKDHWKPTQGNVKRVLLQLATMSRIRPDGVWWIH